MRLHCGVGTAIIFDTVELFESQGIRVIHTELPDNLESLSFYETQNDNVFLFLDKRLPVERRQFRMVYEIANSYLCAADYGRPASEAQENRRFAKRFSAAFLMPDDTVKSLVMQLNIGRMAFTRSIAEFRRRHPSEKGVYLSPLAPDKESDPVRIPIYAAGHLRDILPEASTASSMGQQD